MKFLSISKAMVDVEAKLAWLAARPRVPTDEALDLTGEIGKLAQDAVVEAGGDPEEAITLYDLVARTFETLGDKVPGEDRDLIASLAHFWRLTAQSKRSALASEQPEASEAPADAESRPTPQAITAPMRKLSDSSLHKITAEQFKRGKTVRPLKGGEECPDKSTFHR